MLTIYNEPQKQTWTGLVERPAIETQELEELVQQVFDEVQRKGDEALTKYTDLFDGVKTANFCLNLPEMDSLESQLEPSFVEAIRTAAMNIEAFHSAQKRDEVRVETMPGIECWQRQTPIERVGLYIPAGSAPLFSTLLMLAIPARLAGCRELVLCSPPSKDGKIALEIQYAARLCGLDKLYTLGGIQAVAALTFGTDQVPQVDKVFGPGNQYVTAAKQFAMRKGLSIDLPAGPSEVLVYLDQLDFAPYVAADLLSQAEHGTDSQVILVTPQAAIAEAVNQALEQQLKDLPRKEIATQALENARAVVLEADDHAIDFINSYAPEHLILICQDEEAFVAGIANAGSVFLGAYTPESLGDYASGTNHTLPTAGQARRYGGVDLSSFQKPITYQRATRSGLAALGPKVATLARAEQLEAHARAVTIRLKEPTS